jgi:hypothetical protein
VVTVFQQTDGANGAIFFFRVTTQAAALVCEADGMLRFIRVGVKQ